MTDRYSIAGLTNLLKLVIGRGRIQTTNADGPLQRFQLLLSAKERPTLSRIAEFGLASRPMVGADAVAVFISGNRSNGVIIATNDLNHSFTLANDGESALYNAFGQSVYLTKAGGIVIEAGGEDVTINGAAHVTVHASVKVTLTTPLVEMSGNLNVTGNIHAGGTIGDAVRTIEQDRAIYDTHTHPNGSPNTGIPNQPE